MKNIKPIYQILLLTIPLGAFVVWCFYTGLKDNSPMILVIGMMTLFGLGYSDLLLIRKVKLRHEIGKALVCPNCGKQASLNYVLKKRTISEDRVTDIVLSQCKFCSYRSLPFEVKFELSNEHKQYDSLPYQQRMLINKTSYEAWFFKTTGIRRK